MSQSSKRLILFSLVLLQERDFHSDSVCSGELITDQSVPAGNSVFRGSASDGDRYNDRVVKNFEEVVVELSVNSRFHEIFFLSI